MAPICGANILLKIMLSLLILRYKSRSDQQYYKKTISTVPLCLAFVDNLPQKISESDIILIFSKFDIKNVRLVRDKETDVFKGYCYVEFDILEELHEALEWDGCIFLDDNKMPIRINLAESKNNKKGSKDENITTSRYERQVIFLLQFKHFLYDYISFSGFNSHRERRLQRNGRDKDNNCKSQSQHYKGTEAEIKLFVVIFLELSF